MLPALAWGAAALVLGGLSIITMAGELRAPRQIAVAAGQASEPWFGLSHRSAVTALERCETQLALPATRLLPTPQWQAVLAACRSQADFVVARWPTDARAWLLVATTSSGLADQSRFVAALERSRQFSPAVQWLAERRLALADKAAGFGDYAYAADVLAMLDSDAGARVLAASWLAGDEARKARIEAAATGAAPALQGRFLDKTRQQAASATSS